MILDATTRKVQVLLGGAAATTNPYVVASYIDVASPNKALTPGTNSLQTNGTTAVDAVAAPASGVQRQIKHFSVYNGDTAAVTVTIRYNDNGTTYTILKITLQSGEQIQYSDKGGWYVLTQLSAPKIGAVSQCLGLPDFLGSVGDAANLSTVLTTSTTGSNLDCTYLGVCPKTSSSINVLFRLTTAAVTVVSANIAIFRGKPRGGASSLGQFSVFLEMLGAVDFAGSVTSLGIKNINVPLTVPAQPGDDLWVGFRVAATTAPIYRARLTDGGINAGIAVRGSSAGATNTLLNNNLYSMNHVMQFSEVSSLAVMWVVGFVN